MSVTQPRIVLSGPDWRVVAVEGPDSQGVIVTDYVIEMTEPKDRDSLGVQRWHQLTSKTAMYEWVTIARRFQDLLLRAAGEQPNAKL